MKVKMKREVLSDYVVQIKRLACLHQAGGKFQKIKSELNAALTQLSAEIGPDPGERATTWADLQNVLKRSLIISADPNWIKVIRFAISRVKSYKHNALASRSFSQGCCKLSATRMD